MNRIRFTLFVVAVLCQCEYADFEVKLRWFVEDLSVRRVPPNLWLAKAKGMLQSVVSETVPFPCRLNGTRSRSRPNNVNALRPGDIDVVAGIGDSLTAGFGLTSATFTQFGEENRGIAFGTGMLGTWRQFLTLPNIIKVFNPRLVGGSFYNVGRTGALSIDGPNMAETLVHRLRNDPRVDMQNDWKMVTYHLGPNDFCIRMCLVKDPDSIVKEHKEELIRTLRILKHNLPRTFVNIIETFNVWKVTKLENMSKYCFAFHLQLCPCISFPQLLGFRYSNITEYFETVRKWEKVDREVAYLDEFDTDNFTVVMQPFTHNYKFLTTKEGYIDYTQMSVDCFHLSQKGNARAANALWNNLLEPVGNKSTNGPHLFEKFNCPSAEHPFIFTKRNSKRESDGQD